MRGTRNLALALVLLALAITGPARAGEKAVIAHRGASGYLPEHTLEAYALAYGLGADYIEPDLVVTRDGRLVALHDIYLEGTTDVEAQFPDRKRADGKWYAADFTLEDLKQLRVHERVAGRFPELKSRFEIPTFEEVIELVQGLNGTMGRNVGLYPELKQPSFHRDAALPMEERAIKVLAAYGYSGPDARVFVQCFEPDSLKRLRDELGCTLPLIQLISSSDRQKDLHTREGLKAVARYANGIGPDKKLIEANPAFVAWAHAENLLVHPYTMRSDELPASYASAEVELRRFYIEYDVDAVFTDFPDVAAQWLKEAGLRQGR
jgi:glycerophosphoryl diester phosphodiesterase